jgi:hypothetical protein
MKIFYTCDNCGKPIDSIEVDELDDVKFGFDCLTREERQDLIAFDAEANTMTVQSLCDVCIADLGYANEFNLINGTRFIH